MQGAVVGHAQAPAAVVPAATDRQEHVVLAGEAHAADGVGHVGAARYQARALVDHAVVALAGFVIPRITGLDELPAQGRPEFRQGWFVEHGRPLLSPATPDG